MTDPAIEREALALFEQLLDLPEQERDAWLAARVAGRPQLASRLAAIRDADRRAAIHTGAGGDTLAEEAAPERIGAYRIVERIGRGGMGSVYRGERMTGDFAHVVAIKVIKPGLLSEPLIERFRTERQTLAQLVHPNIAHLHDGGETAAGSPYIVMEYVDGLPLLRWADEVQPSRAERLRLFRDICAAVAFAHRSLIVHRDLTPSNVLVTRDGAVKLIDFGIAKPASDATPSRGGASVGSLSLTPGYAAPERMTSAAVTTAADIYSLGRLLERLVPPASGDRDLRAIVARATATSPEDRYATADAMGDDVDRWARGLTVAATNGGRGYMLGKFIGRHRLGVGAAAAAVVLLVGALVLTANAYARAESARVAEAARFQELRSLAGFVLFDLDGRLRGVIGNAEVRERLADRAQTYLSALARSRGASPAVKLEAARGFIALARVQGVPAQPNLGETEAARANLTTAVRVLAADTLPRARAIPEQAEALALLALIAAHVDADLAVAGKLAARAQAGLVSVPAAEHGPAWLAARSQLRRTQLDLALLGGRPDDMTRTADLLERETAAWPAPLRQSRAAAIDRAYAEHYRGIGGYFEDRLEAAVEHFAEAQRRFVALDRSRANDPLVLYMLAYNGYTGYGAASGVDRLAPQAKAFLAVTRQTIDRLLPIEPRDHSLRAFSTSVRGAESQLLASEGRFVDAIALQRAVVAFYRDQIRRAPSPALANRLVTAQVTLANIMAGAGDRTGACAASGEAASGIAMLERRRELIGSVGRYKTGIAGNLALCRSGAPAARFAHVE